MKKVRGWVLCEEKQIHCEQKKACGVMKSFTNKEQNSSPVGPKQQFVTKQFHQLKQICHTGVIHTLINCTISVQHQSKPITQT